MTVQIGPGAQPLHQGGRRHHQDPLAALGQPVEGRQPLGDDVLMGREDIVGQGLPVRKQVHRDGGGGEQFQFGLQMQGSLAVGDQGQH